MMGNVGSFCLRQKPDQAAKIGANSVGEKPGTGAREKLAESGALATTVNLFAFRAALTGPSISFSSTAEYCRK